MGRYGWRNVDGVVVRPGRTWSASAVCDGCEVFGGTEEYGSGALTSRVKRHVAKTGHRVVIQRTRSVFVERDADAD